MIVKRLPYFEYVVGKEDDLSKISHGWVVYNPDVAGRLVVFIAMRYLLSISNGSVATSVRRL